MNTMCLLSLLLSLLIYLSKYYINYLQNKKKQYNQDIVFLIRLSLQNSKFSRKKCGIKYIGYIKKYFPYNYSVRNQAFKERYGICQAPRRQRRQPWTPGIFLVTVLSLLFMIGPSDYSRWVMLTREPQSGCWSHQKDQPMWVIRRLGLWAMCYQPDLQRQEEGWKLSSTR